MDISLRNKTPEMILHLHSLAESMSRYLISRIEATSTIALWPYTKIMVLEGEDHLKLVRWQNSQTGQTEEHKISHVFIMNKPL